ncbi:MAG: hypothetical protein IPO23_13240 [Flavobacterium sp.]|nr:hypothetical protein [Flavobacterium sp.]
MKIYYVTTFKLHHEFHVVHVEGCSYLPTFLSRQFLGRFPSYEEALKESKKIYPTSLSASFALTKNYLPINHEKLESHLSCWHFV